MDSINKDMSGLSANEKKHSEENYLLKKSILGTLRKSDRSYPEDYDHENGNYANQCIDCDQLFMGHKRRVICKKCLTNN